MTNPTTDPHPTPALTASRWITATFLGWLLGFLLSLILSAGLDSVGIGNVQFYLGLGMGAGVGFTQWRWLRKRTGMNRRWIWLSAAGVGIPFLLFDLLKYAADWKIQGGHYILLCTALGGLLAGILQGRLLPRQGLSYRWIAASFAGWFVAAATVMAIDYTKYVSDSNLVLFILNVLLILGGGVVLGIITGTAVKIFAKSVQIPAATGDEKY